MGSLDRLRTDYIDIYQIHWPEEKAATPIEEIVETLEEFKNEGLIRRYGLTNHSYFEIMEYTKHGCIKTSQIRVDFLKLDELSNLRTVCNKKIYC